MATMITGIVQDGKIIPDALLPDGLHVQIVLLEPVHAEEAELQAEMAAWRAGSAKAFARVEELSDGEITNAQG